MAGEMVISARMAEFIHRCIHSVEELRVLLLLQEQAGREFSPEEINNELRSTVASIEKRVRDLIDKKVLSPESFREGRARFVPFSVEVEELVMILAGHFRIRPYKVIDLIFSRPDSAIQSFADSFRLKKDKG